MIIVTDMSPFPLNSYLEPEKLKQWRTRLHITQEQASSLLGMSLRQYGNYERGLSPISKPLALALIVISQFSDLSFPFLKAEVEGLLEEFFNKGGK